MARVVPEPEVPSRRALSPVATTGSSRAAPPRSRPTSIPGRPVTARAYFSSWRPGPAGRGTEVPREVRAAGDEGGGTPGPRRDEGSAARARGAAAPARDRWHATRALLPVTSPLLPDGPPPASDDAIELAPEDVDRDAVAALLRDHLSFAHSTTLPEHVHAMDRHGLRGDGVLLFGARRRGVLVGIGALKRLDADHAELKSMHTLAAARGQGVGRAMVEHLLRAARGRGYRRVSLETGAQEPSPRPAVSTRGPVSSPAGRSPPTPTPSTAPT